MKTRLLCLLLCAVMLLACLAGCSQKTDEEAKEDIEEEASQSAMTLCMYLLSENKISPEQEASIETAVNRITKAKFKTQLDLKFFTADEYYTQLEAAFAARKAAEDAGQIAAPVEGDETKEDETVMSEIGIQIKYPTIASYQVDIFYLGGYEKFSQYVEEGRMQALDTELESASKKLKEYITPSLLTYLDKVEGSVYGIPTNTAVGEYTYILLNNEVLGNYDTTAGREMLAGGLTDAELQKFLSDVKTDSAYSDYAPIYSAISNTELVSLSEVMSYHASADVDKEVALGVQYFGVNALGQFSDSFSLIGCDYRIGSKLGEKDKSCMYGIGQTVDNNVFQKSLMQVMSYKQGGYFGTEEQFKNGKAAVAFVKGGASVPDEYAKLGYTAVAIKNPTIDTMDLYDNMFAVSSYTANTARSMEIITHLNTDEEFRNILLYGVENENYELVDSDYTNPETGLPYKCVKRLNENYMMDSKKVGNTLIGHYAENENPADREYIQKQNRDVTATITMGFKYTNDVSVDSLKKLRDISASVEALINGYTPVATDDWTDTTKYADTDLIKQIKDITGAAENKALLTELSNDAEPETDTSAGIAYIYKLWAESTKIFVDHSEDNV